MRRPSASSARDGKHRVSSRRCVPSAQSGGVAATAGTRTVSIEQAKEEGGDLLEPIKRGRITWDGIHEIGDVVAGKVRGRTNADDITLFKSHGIAIEDVAVGALVFERARDRGIGKSVAL